MDSQKATFGAGCFWSVEKNFKSVKGVYMVQVGYMGGKTLNPTYHDICRGDTNHAEVLQIAFSPEIISYSDLLKIFWKNHNPTTLNQQGPDMGTQYRSVIFYQNDKQKELAESSISTQQTKWGKEIVTQIIPSEKWKLLMRLFSLYIDTIYFCP